MPGVTELDADSILYYLKLSCKAGILRKANITNLGKKGNDNAEPKGLLGYQEATTELYKDFNDKVDKYIDTGFPLADDSPVNNVKYKDIMYLGFDIYGQSQTLIDNSQRNVVVWSNCTSRDKYTQSYDTVEFLAAVTRNTSADCTKVTESGELSREATKAMKEEKAMDILDRIDVMLDNPISTFVRLVAGFLQWIHTGLSEGTLGSLFYITNEDIQRWCGNLPMNLFLFSLALFCIKLAWLALKYLFTKEIPTWKVFKTYIVTACMIAIPVALLSWVQIGIKYISDTMMSDSIVKLESVYLNSQLESSTELAEVSEETEDSSVEYFIEHFQRKNMAKVAIQVLDNDVTVNKKTTNPNEGKVYGFTYETLDLRTIPDIFQKIAKENAENTSDTDSKLYSRVYNGDNFCTVLYEHYDESIFYYFLDYYINQWCLLNGKYNYYDASSPSWTTTMQSEMVSSNETFRNYYKKRVILYGPSAGLGSMARKLDDVFGLGTLFYVDGHKPVDRGFLYPLEIFDNHVREASRTGLYAGVLKATEQNPKPTAYGIADTTYAICKNPVWNAYKQSSKFEEDDYGVKIKYLSGDKYKGDYATTNDKRSAEATLGYGPIALQERALAFSKSNTVSKGTNPIVMSNQVIASEALFTANEIDTKYATSLEQNLWRVNENIYESVQEYFDCTSENMSDYTDIVMLAAISTFEFNKKFGTVLKINPDFKFLNVKSGQTYFSAEGESTSLLIKGTSMEPISFDKAELDLDTILQAIYCNTAEIAETDMEEIMYILGDNGFGILCCIILIVAEILLTAFTFLRMIHLIILLVLATIICCYSYGWKKDLSNKAWLGCLAQVAYLLVSHMILIFCMSITIKNEFPTGAGYDILISLILFIGSFLALVVETIVMLFLVNNIRDLGGSVVMSKLQELRSKINGKLDGSLDSDSTELNSESTESFGNDDDEEIQEQSNGTGAELDASVTQADKVRGNTGNINAGSVNAESINAESSNSGGSSGGLGGSSDISKAVDVAKSMQSPTADTDSAKTGESKNDFGDISFED